MPNGERSYEKRLNYFHAQFLQEEDFTDEQSYHVEMRKRHNRLLHTWGVADGLLVERDANRSVSISSGVAIDKDGREIVLLKPEPHNLETTGTNGPIYLTICFGEEESDGESGKFTRTTEKPVVGDAASAPAGDGSVILLAQIKLDSSGHIAPDGGIDNSVRILASAAVREGGIGTAELADGAVIEDKLHPNTRDKLVTNGNDHDHAGGDGAQIKHSTLDQDDGGNPHGTTAADVGALVSLDGVSNPGGNIDLIARNAVTIQPDDARNQIIVSENHSGLLDNPHAVNADQVGALPKSGGTIHGSLTVEGKIHQKESGQLYKYSARFWSHGPDPRWGVIALISPNPNQPPLGKRAAILGLADIDDVHGVYARARDGTHALYVKGTSMFTGAKTGYVVDVFANASGQKLSTGDIVMLTGAPIVRFQGDNNKIPIPEVTLADRENDCRVIGIVDRAAIPEQDSLDDQTRLGDPTFIENGGELFVVTLGAYAHCKVDASEAPIAVGDLLTTSSNPGHAKKATEPKIGAIIGKALEPLDEGTGYISIFVNIQ